MKVPLVLLKQETFRNEIVAQIYFRMREFEQMEMQFLCVR
jgi:glycyl-tRNA synthetase (class II)